MSKQLELQHIPRRRAVLVDAGTNTADPGSVVVGPAPNQTTVTGSLEVDVEAFFTGSWQVGADPVLGGWYDAYPEGADEEEARRVWWKPGSGWYTDRQVLTRLIPPQGRRVVWRGLTAPHPDGYTYRVPGITRFVRAKVL
jgi:hypothetical protein